MKALRSLAIAAILLTVPVILESCSIYGCNEPSMKFNIASITIDAYMYDGQTNVPAPEFVIPTRLRLLLDIERSSAFYIERPRATMAAYACDPEPPSSKEKVTAFKITSDYNLITSEGMIFEAGTDIGNVFTSSISTGYPIYSDAYIQPVFKINKASTQKFFITISLDDGRTFELQSGSFNLLPE